MKLRLFIIFSFTLFSSGIFGQDIKVPDSTDTKLSSSYPPVYFPVLIDPGLTMRSGTENILTVHKGITALEDKLIGTRWFRESGVLRKTGGILARSAKFIFLDIPLDYFSVVLSHEYFGHGSRYRELKIDKVHYGFDWPPPYGSGGGEASIYTAQVNDHELISIWIGGLEAHPLINKNIRLRWMTDRAINYREASQYFFCFQIMMNYIQNTKEDLNDGTDDNDPRAYVRILNAHAGYTDVNNLPMSVKDMKSKMVWNVADPFILFSLYSIFKTYLWDGGQVNKMPIIRFGSIGYLPALRAGYTPFGIEYHWENYIRFRKSVSMIDLHYGDRTFYKSWGGAGMVLKNICNPRNFSFDINFNLWRQPGLQSGVNPVISKSGGLGGSLSARGYYDFPGIRLPLSAVLELGYKTAGFLEGYNLDASPIVMAGLALRK